MAEAPEIYRVSEFCKHYKISRTSLYKEINEQRLHIVKRGRRTFITRPEAERWFNYLCHNCHSEQMTS